MDVSRRSAVMSMLSASNDRIALFASCITTEGADAKRRDTFSERNTSRGRYATEPRPASRTTASPSTSLRPGSPTKRAAIVSSINEESAARAFASVSRTSTSLRTTLTTGVSVEEISTVSPRVDQPLFLMVSFRRRPIVLNSRKSNIFIVAPTSGMGASALRSISTGTSRFNTMMAALRITRSPCSSNPAFSFGVCASAAATTS